jgi:hypothetical protein
VARMGDRRSAYRVLARRPEGKRKLGRPRCRWGAVLEWIFKKSVGWS